MKTKLLSALVCCFLIANTNLSATTLTINVGEGGAMTFTPADLTVVLGDTVKWVWVSGSHTTTATSLPVGAATWDAPINSGATSYSYVPAVAGDYTYKCTPHAGMGMVGSFTVITCTTPVSNTIFGGSSVCSGIPETLVVPNGPDYVFAWYKDGIAIPGASSNTYAATDTVGTVNYSVVVSNSCGADTTDTFALVTNPTPVAVIHDTIIGGAVVFSTITLSGATYHWDFGDDATSTSANPTHTYAIDGATDTVSLAITSDHGCVGTIQKIITTPGLKVNVLTPADDRISIFPNPASDKAIINYSINATSANMVIEDVTGRVVYSTAFTSQQGQVTVPVGNYSAGIYIVTINAGTTRYIKKLVKQ